MSKTKCEQLKSIQKDILSFREDFESDFEKFLENRVPIDSINQRNLGDALKTLFNLLDDAWTNAPSGKIYIMGSPDITGMGIVRNIKVNFRKEFEVSPGNILKVGDIVTGKNSVEYTVVGFELKTNEVILSYVESSMGGLRKKTKYIFYKALDLE